MPNLKFSRQTNFTGRNGYFKCSGIELLITCDDKVMLTPLTSRGEPARCDVTVPVEDIPALIEMLNDRVRRNEELNREGYPVS